MDKLKGGWFNHWDDFTHEFEGHGIDTGPEDREGENLFDAELMSFYI